LVVELCSETIRADSSGKPGHPEIAKSYADVVVQNFDFFTQVTHLPDFRGNVIRRKSCLFGVEEDCKHVRQVFDVDHGKSLIRPVGNRYFATPLVAEKIKELTTPRRGSARCARAKDG